MRRHAPAAHAPANAPRCAVALYALATYALLSAFASAAGRAFYGTSQALSSRYTTISQLFWIALFMLLYLSLRQSEQTPAAEAAPSRHRLTLRVLVVCGALIALPSLKDAHFFKDNYNRLLPDQEAMRQGRTNLPALAFSVDASNKGIVILHKWHLNLFHDPHL